MGRKLLYPEGRVFVGLRFTTEDMATIDAARAPCGATRQSWLHAAALAYSSKAMVKAREPASESWIDWGQRDLGKPLATLQFGPTRAPAGSRTKGKK